MKYLGLLVVIGTFILNTAVTGAQIIPQDASPTTSIVLFQVKTEGIAAGDEYVLLYNTLDSPIDIAGWCLQYSSASDNPGFKVCIESAEYLVDGGTFISFGTTSFMQSTNFALDFTISGGMSSTGGHVRLLDTEDNEVDKLGWGTAVSPEMTVSIGAPIKHNKSDALSRSLESAIIDSNDNITDFTSRKLIYQCPNSGMILYDEYYVAPDGSCVQRFCPNLLTSTTEAPEGYYKPEGETNCELIPVVLENRTLFITELLPNVTSTDTGKEFIELYNPNDESVPLEGYTLQMGPSYEKVFGFSGGNIGARSYITFSDTVTGLALPNTNGVQLRLLTPKGTLVSETTTYSNAKNDESWALIEDQWVYTNQPTPGAANKPYLIAAVDEVLGVTSVLAPCPEGKFRNPATNRCKTIETAISALQPCDEDEFRNPETNRCNKLSTSSSSLTPCKPGQARNPDTNRCRSIAATSSGLKPCEAGEERNPETNRCRKVAVLSASDAASLVPVNDVKVETTGGQINWAVITLAMGATIGYMLYEWRVELVQQISRFKKI